MKRTILYALGPSVTLTQAASSNMPFRGRSLAPLSRQQQQLLLPHGFEEMGDDSIVPSTPTLYVPRRTDGFGEAVSSPHVPNARFTFGETLVAPRSSHSQVVDVNDDSRLDLSQLDDSGASVAIEILHSQFGHTNKNDYTNNCFKLI